jgi:membrane protease subunit (stomatin/prohibitin family)
MVEIREEKIKYERAEKERIARFTCPACKKVNMDSASFCEECGTKVGELVREFCRACCTMNPQGMKFCGECGAKLEDAPAQ